MASDTRRLIVLRHAKSDWHSGALNDHERPLNNRGRKAAPRIAEHLHTLGWVPEVVFSSDSMRTRQTWERMQGPLGGQPAVTFTWDLYLAGPPEVRAALSDVPAEVVTAMVIGHNPGWEEVVYELTGVQVRMTTCNAALLRTESPTWADAVARGDWVFEQVLRPKEL